MCCVLKALIKSIIGSTCSLFFFKKKLFFYFVASSIIITQCYLPPMLCFLIDEMSRYILSPGFSLLSSFFFGIFFCLIFSDEQLWQLFTFPVKEPCNTLLWHPSNDVQHVLSLFGSILLTTFHSQSLH